MPLRAPTNRPKHAAAGHLPVEIGKISVNRLDSSYSDSRAPNLWVLPRNHVGLRPETLTQENSLLITLHEWMPNDAALWHPDAVVLKAFQYRYEHTLQTRL